jgi:hypothetical protein
MPLKDVIYLFPFGLFNITDQSMIKDLYRKHMQNKILANIKMTFIKHNSNINEIVIRNSRNLAWISRFGIKDSIIEIK